MPAPKRLSRPRRLNASPAAGMFPHAVTLYNVAVRTGRGTVRSTVESSVTLLRGVFLDASRGADPDRNGLEGADGAVLYVPSGVEAVDAVTGELKAYLPPVEFWSAGDKSGFWTLAASSRSAPGYASGGGAGAAGGAVRPGVPRLQDQRAEFRRTGPLGDRRGVRRPV